MRLGIDIGRVLIAPGGNGGKADTSFLDGSLEAALDTPAMEGALEAVRQLVEAFEQRVWLISKCGPRVQQRTRRWLDHHAFHETTGLRRDRVVFCLERPQKAGHCARLGIQSFIDDRLDVLQAMRGTVPHLFLFGEQRGEVVEQPWFTKVGSWSAALPAVLERARPGAGRVER